MLSLLLAITSTSDLQPSTAIANQLPAIYRGKINSNTSQLLLIVSNIKFVYLAE